MVLDALRGYVQLASGLTEVNRKKAVAEAKSLLATGGAVEQLLGAQAKDLADDVGRQVQALADELVATSRVNRQMLTTMIRTETERAVGSLGLATAEEISALRRHVERLEQKLAAQAATPTAAPTAAASGARRTPVKKAAAATETSATKRPAATKKAAAKRAAPATKKSASTATKKSTTTPRNPRD